MRLFYLFNDPDAQLTRQSDGSLSYPVLLEHMSPSFIGKLDNKPFSVNHAQHLDSRSRALQHMPYYHCEVITSIAKVGEDGRKAKAWTFKRLSGLPGGVCKDGVSAMKWERRGQVWMCVTLRTVRNMGEHG